MRRTRPAVPPGHARRVTTSTAPARCTPADPGSRCPAARYTGALRGPQHRWWRPLVGAAAVTGGLVAVVLALGITFGVAQALTGRSGTALDEAVSSTWWGLLAMNLALAAGVPLAWLGVRAGHRRGPGAVSSVEGRWRWRWALRVVPVVLAVLVAANLAVVAVEVLAGRAPFGPGTAPGARQAVALVVVVVLTTPLQAAGEEFFFRGWLSQAVGSWSARPAVGAVLAALASAALFSAAHGAEDALLFADRVVFGLVASWLVWRTGGLEAAVVLHAVNNVVLMVPAALAGALTVTPEVAPVPPLLVAVDVTCLLVAAAAVTALTRRAERTRPDGRSGR